MSRIVIFDSGFGSLSIIKAIQKCTKAEVIYFADQQNYPYGKKTKRELEKIIKNTINNLQNKFNPNLIVVGSNTPSLLADKIFSDNDRILGVLPPIFEAQRLSKTNSIALLVTSSVAKSNTFDKFITKNLIKKIKIIKIDASELVDLVESGAFIYKKNLCINKILSTLEKTFSTNNVDVATLSSTHLPFLLPFLEKLFPQITFLDPANKIANQILHHKSFSPSKKNSLKIFTSGDTKSFQTHLHEIGIKKIVHNLSF